MLQLGVRKSVEDLVEPVVNSQEHIQRMLENTLVADVEKLQEQVKFLEHHVYGEEGPEFRFEQIEKRHRHRPPPQS